MVLIVILIVVFYNNQASDEYKQHCSNKQEIVGEYWTVRCYTASAEYLTGQIVAAHVQRK
jgi:hypothetical protein